MTTRLTSILQWNIQGLSNKKDELIDLIHSNQSSIIAIQETKLSHNYLLKIPNFNIYSKDGHYNQGWHGGVALYIHSDIPHHAIELTTDIQAVAVEVHINFKFTICNIYNSRSHSLTQNSLLNLINQLPQPFLLLGDFNAYHQLWGCTTNDSRGAVLEGVISSGRLCVLNDGRPTRIGYSSQTAIDLTISSPTILNEFSWNVSSTPLDSDHCPITITLNDSPISTTETTLNLKNADWTLFRNSDAWNSLPSIDSTDNPALIADFYQRIRRASSDSIPSFIPSKFYPKPWWTPELSTSRQMREHLYQQYRHRDTQENMIRWKRARAKHKNLIKRAKQESFRAWISEISPSMPVSDFYKRINSLKGRSPRRLTFLTENNVQYCSPLEIANLLAQTFGQVSSTSNYDVDFQRLKTVEETTPINFSDSDDFYNLDFSEHDFHYSLSKTKNSAPGEDKIRYQMLKELPSNAKAHLLKIFNKFFRLSFYPREWSHAIVVPILKQGKDPTSKLSYRPIALTSCLGKLFERMLNERLLAYLDIKSCLSNVQCGGRKGRSTTDHLVRLERVVQETFASKEHFVSIFFDLEKAFDMTWKFGILKDLYNFGLRGNLPKYIDCFLRNRSFSVRVNQTMSGRVCQENGVPQGSVLSPTLFAIKINSILQNFPSTPRLLTSLYVDDLQVGFRHPDIQTIGVHLQDLLTRLSAWTKANGFKFNTDKTTVLHFTRLPGFHIPPDLYLDNKLLPYRTNAKFLGLYWDQKLTWNIHLSRLKTDCTKLLNLLKVMTSQKWGARQDSVLKVYRTYVRAKLDYGAVVYSSASPTALKTLDPIANEAMRVATGAFRSTPIQSLEVLTGEPGLELRRELLTLRYFIKIRATLSNPAFSSVMCSDNPSIFNSIFKPFGVRAKILAENFNVRFVPIQPQFSYILSNLTVPMSSLDIPQVDTSLALFPKQSTSPVVFQQNFSLLISSKFTNFTKIFTDGSKSSSGVGSAAVCGDKISSASLPKFVTIFSAELYAIWLALSLVRDFASSKFLVCSDSLSALSAIQNYSHPNPHVRKIQVQVMRLREDDIVIGFLWLPSHVGIRGNEIADTVACRAAMARPTYFPTYYKELYPLINEVIKEKRLQRWTSSGQKLLEVQENLDPSPTFATRTDEVLMNRLRAGHCLFSHQHLMDSSMLGPRVCHFCGDALLSVRHVFLECVALRQQQRVLGRRTHPLPVLRDLLTVYNVNNVKVFLGQIGLLEHV